MLVNNTTRQAQNKNICAVSTNMTKYLETQFDKKKRENNRCSSSFFDLCTHGYWNVRIGFLVGQEKVTINFKEEPVVQVKAHNK